MDFARWGKGSTRIVLIPGGPGLFTSFYRELVDLLADLCEVVTYEQRGSYYADMENYPTTVEEYVGELREVLGSLPEPEKPTILLGHSFGGAVAIDALLADFPVSGAILSNTFSSNDMFKRGQDYRISQFPEEFHKRRAEIGDDREALDALIAEYWFPHYFCRVTPMPASIAEGLEKVNTNVLAHFLGQSIFLDTGAMRDWNREKDLATIEHPVLVISAAYDYYRPDDIESMASSFPNGRLWISDSGSHSTWIEDPEGYKEQVSRFLSQFA